MVSNLLKGAVTQMAAISESGWFGGIMASAVKREAF